VLIDIPVGPTAKVRTDEAARDLAHRLEEVGRAVGLHVRCVFTDGLQPVGRGVGPALEARDVMAVLRRDTAAPADLRARALYLAGEVIEMAGRAATGDGKALATAVLDDGRALQKFQRICLAQGGAREPTIAPHRRDFLAPVAGTIAAIDNRRIARFAKLAGAPISPAAGLEMRVVLGQRVPRGEPLFTLHAESIGEMQYACDYVEQNLDAVAIAHGVP
jgi:thymidine phosphorylase